MKALEHATAYGAFDARAIVRILEVRFKPRQLAEQIATATRSQIREAMKGEMRRALDDTRAEPAKDVSRLDWLWRLVEPQVRRRVESRAERRIHDARLPVRKTFEAFDFAFQPKLDKDLVIELATLRFVAQGKNVLLAGMSGTGKSHIALALGLIACAANRRVLYTTSADMLARLNMSLADDTLAHALKPYTRADLLIIDEVGLEQVERDAARRSGLMQKVLLPRYNEPRATIITSNIPWDAWGDYLGDHLGATALIDRLLHRSHVIVINGPSYRDWTHHAGSCQRAERRHVGPRSRTAASDSTHQRSACGSSSPREVMIASAAVIAVDKSDLPVP